MLSNTYIISEDKHCFIVDPCENEPVKEIICANSLTIDYCFLTHEHYDHISGLDWMHGLNVPVIGTESCNRNLGDSKINQSRYYDAFSSIQVRLKNCPIVHVDEYTGYADITFNGSKTLFWEGHELLMKETPGHSRGSACLLVDDKILFSGDTLLGDTYTGTNMLSGSEDELEKISMPWLERLNHDIVVYAGHGSEFLLGDRLSKKFEKPRKK